MNEAKPKPLPKPLVVIIAAGAGIFFSPALLLLPFEEPVPQRAMGVWSLICVGVVLAGAFVMLREFFSAPRKGSAKRGESDDDS